jgi:acetyltransferase-like isoleucine patch superfamily enzyme
MLRTAFRVARERWDNHRDPVGFARRIGVRVGQRCRFLGTDRSTFGSEPYLVTIGDHVTITDRVRFITHDGGVWIFRDEFPNIDIVAPIRVGDNVFLGLGSLIMPGVDIGSNVVVAAGSVVTRSVPPDRVVAGVPARVIKATDEYLGSVLPRALHVRHLPLEERRKIFNAQQPTNRQTPVTNSKDR